jgi:hypothetical protein
VKQADLEKEEGVSGEEVVNILKLQEIYKSDDFKSIILHEAEKLEGTVRNTGIHAAGIIIGPSDLMEILPYGFEAKDIWILDKAITQSELGVGVFEWSTTVTSTVLAPSDDVMALQSGDAPQAVDSQNRPDSTRPAGENSSSGTSTSKLLSTASRRKTTSEDVFEGIARETKLAADSGRFYSGHVQDGSTVEFWLRAYVAHISSLHEESTAKRSSENETSNEAFVDTLPEHIKDYLGFVLETLLKSQCRYCLAKFTF